MTSFNAGKFSVSVFTDGYPISVSVDYRGEQALRLTHTELRDLRHVLKQAMKAARRALSANQKTEV